MGKLPQLYISFYILSVPPITNGYSYVFDGKLFIGPNANPVLSSPQNSRWRPKQGVVTVLADVRSDYRQDRLMSVAATEVAETVAATVAATETIR